MLLPVLLNGVARENLDGKLASCQCYDIISGVNLEVMPVCQRYILNFIM